MVVCRLCQLNLSFILLAIYFLYYLTLDFFAALTWSIFVRVPLWLTANLAVQTLPYAWAWAIGVHILGWYMQIHPGHALLEHRKPALLDSFFQVCSLEALLEMSHTMVQGITWELKECNFLQSLVLAPLFVWFELLFQLGYRPKLYAEMKKAVAANIAQHKAQHQALLNKKTASPDQ